MQKLWRGGVLSIFYPAEVSNLGKLEYFAGSCLVIAIEYFFAVCFYVLSGQVHFIYVTLLCLCRLNLPEKVKEEMYLSISPRLDYNKPENKYLIIYLTT